MKAEQTIKDILDAVDTYCNDIRYTIAGADLLTEDGRADMMRDVRIRIENIEGKVADLRGRDDEIATERGRNRAKARRVRGLQRFFHFVDAHDDDIWINVFRIAIIVGKEVTMTDGRTFSLTPEQAEELQELVGANPSEASA